MIYLSFLLSLVIFFLQFFSYGPSLPIIAFIPFLTLTLLLCPLNKALLFSFSVGLLLDLLSADPFAIHALNYTLTAAFSYRIKRLFSSEAPLQFCLYTAFSSFISTGLQIGLLFLFDRRILFEGKWWITEWALLPLFDALYALIWFAAPLALFRWIRRAWQRAYPRWIVYWLKKKNLFLN